LARGRARRADGRHSASISAAYLHVARRRARSRRAVSSSSPLLYIRGQARRAALYLVILGIRDHARAAIARRRRCRPVAGKSAVPWPSSRASPWRRSTRRPRSFYLAFLPQFVDPTAGQWRCRCNSSLFGIVVNLAFSAGDLVAVPAPPPSLLSRLRRTRTAPTHPPRSSAGKHHDRGSGCASRRHATGAVARAAPGRRYFAESRGHFF